MLVFIIRTLRRPRHPIQSIVASLLGARPPTLTLRLLIVLRLVIQQTIRRQNTAVTPQLEPAHPRIVEQLPDHPPAPCFLAHETRTYQLTGGHIEVNRAISDALYYRGRGGVYGALVVRRV